MHLAQHGHGKHSTLAGRLAQRRLEATTQRQRCFFQSLTEPRPFHQKNLPEGGATDRARNVQSE